ncbi:MAG: hypothetical protein AAGF91_06020 [Actinomycetota bacterium]
MRNVWFARSLGALVLTVLAVLLPDGIAHADPAGPTDYRTEVESIVPPTPEIEVEILGGDSFVQLTVADGVEVEIVGYQGEPYLWFRTDGTVWENRNSPTTYQNEERYGSDAPAFARADAEPDWEEVSSDGSYAWHDHRAHWMQPIRPAGLAPGDQILAANIPLLVDGRDVDVAVSSTWLPEPSRLPALAGAVIGVLAAVAGALLRRSNRPWAVVVIPVAVVAAVVGWIQFASLPPETGPRILWWVPAVIAVVAAVVGVGIHRRDPFWADGAVLLAGVNLLIWAFIKRDGLGAAIVPTDAPGWLDRATVAAAFTMGVGAIVVAVRAILATPGTRAVPAAT